MRKKHLIPAFALCLSTVLAGATPGKGQTSAPNQPAGQSLSAVSHDPAVVSKIKNAADAQGDISPLTLKALQNDPKAMEAVGRAPSNPAPANAPRDGGPKSSKAMYGDIVIHK